MRPEEEEYYKKLGDIKSNELNIRVGPAYELFKVGEKSKQVMGAIKEEITREFIREYLPPGFNVDYGIVYDMERGKHSPEIDAIIYTRSPLMKFGEVVIVEKEQVKMVIEVKSWSGRDDIFGAPKSVNGKSTRDPNTMYKKIYTDRKSFASKYVLFTFSIDVAKSIKDDEIIQRLNEISDQYVVVSIVRSKNRDINFDKSVSKFIRTLRTLRF